MPPTATFSPPHPIPPNIKRFLVIRKGKTEIANAPFVGDRCEPRFPLRSSSFYPLSLCGSNFFPHQLVFCSRASNRDPPFPFPTLWFVGAASYFWIVSQKVSFPSHYAPCLFSSRSCKERYARILFGSNQHSPLCGNISVSIS